MVPLTLRHPCPTTLEPGHSLARVLQEAKKLGYDYYLGLECRPKGDEITAAKRVAAADVW